MNQQLPIDPAADIDLGWPTPMTDRPPLANVFNSRLAHAEGWDVFDCGLREDGSPRTEIQRIDCPDEGEPVRADNSDAWRHVVERARRLGSASACRADGRSGRAHADRGEFRWWPEPPD
ncbi:MAG: hypothetical protein WBQ75_12630 [Acetobacteraceae bacterium]